MASQAGELSSLSSVLDAGGSALQGSLNALSLSVQKSAFSASMEKSSDGADAAGAVVGKPEDVEALRSQASQLL